MEVEMQPITNNTNDAKPAARPVVRVTIWIHGTQAAQLFGFKSFLPAFYREFPGMAHVDHVVGTMGEGNHRFCQIASALNGAHPEKHPREHIYFFGWSGTLSEAARLKAGEELFDGIVQLIEKYTNTPENPRVKLTILTHSHGGNVALSMVRYDRIQQRLKRDRERQEREDREELAKSGESSSEEEKEGEGEGQGKKVRRVWSPRKRSNSREEATQSIEELSQSPPKHQQSKPLLERRASEDPQRLASQRGLRRARTTIQPASALSCTNVSTTQTRNTGIEFDDEGDFTPTFVISKLILLACPIMDDWKHHVAHPMFARVYSLYSKSDLTQLLGSTGSVWQGSRSFPISQNVIQSVVDLRMHISFSRAPFLSRLPTILAELKRNNVNSNSSSSTLSDSVEWENEDKDSREAEGLDRMIAGGDEQLLIESDSAQTYFLTSSSD